MIQRQNVGFYSLADIRGKVRITAASSLCKRPRAARVLGRGGLDVRHMGHAYVRNVCSLLGADACKALKGRAGRNEQTRSSYRCHLPKYQEMLTSN